MKRFTAGLALTLGFFACPPPVQQTRCETPDAGSSETDAGSSVDAGNPTTDESLRFVNLTDQTLTFVAEDAGAVVEAFSSRKSQKMNKPGHITLNRRTISVSAAGQQPVSFDCDIDLQLDGEVRKHSCVAVAQTAGDGGVALRKGWDGTVKGGSKLFSERMSDSLGTSATALGLGVDLTGDCLADVGTGVGQPASIAVFTADTATVCSAENVWAFRAQEFINEEEVEDISLVRSGGGQPALAYRLRVWQLMQGQNSASTVILGRPIPDVYVMNARTTGGNDDYSFAGRPFATGAQPGRPIQLTPSAAYALKTKTKSNNTNERLMVGGASLPVVSGTLTGPCRPPYLCDFVPGGVSSEDSWETMGRTASLLVVTDTEARLIDLPAVPAAGTVETPYFLPIVVGADRPKATVCLGNDVTCVSNSAVSFDVRDSEVTGADSVGRRLPVPRLGSTSRTQVRVSVPGAGGLPDSSYFTAPLVLPTRSSIFVVAAGRLFDVAAAPDAKIVVQLDAKRKNYVGHVTLIKQ